LQLFPPTPAGVGGVGRSGFQGLAFDHKKIIDYAHLRIRNKLDYTNVGFQLLPPNFRRKVAQQGIVKPVDEWAQTGRKPATCPAFPIQRNIALLFLNPRNPRRSFFPETFVAKQKSPRLAPGAFVQTAGAA
jgi:hypothetical protein